MFVLVAMLHYLLLKNILCLDQINILHIMDENDNLAEPYMTKSLKRLRDNGKNYTIKRVAGRENHLEKFLDDLCTSYEQMLAENNPPSIVIDNTFFNKLALGVKSFTSSLNIPTVSISFGNTGDLGTWDDVSQNERKIFVQINRPREIIPEVVRSIVDFQGYLTAAVLFDDTYEIGHKYKSLLENLPTRHTIAYINTTHVIQQLLNIKKSNIFNFFLVGSLGNIHSVLDAADAISMFQPRFSWHVITHESGKLTCQCRRAQVVYIAPKMKGDVSLWFYNYVDDLAFNATWKMYSDASNLNRTYLPACQAFNGTNKPNTTQLNLLKYIRNEINNNENISLTQSSDQSLSMVFNMNVYMVNFREGSLLNYSRIGSWVADYDSPMVLVSPQVLKRAASRVVYRIVTLEYPPFVYKDPKAKKGFSGYCIDLIEEISEIMTFDYELNAVVDNAMGHVDEEGQWNGLVNELIAKRADIALSALSITSERERVVDFTVPYYELIGHSILMKWHETPTSLFRFLQVFNSQVWFAILAMYLATSLYMWVLYRLSPYGQGYVKRKKKRVRNFNLIECYWFSLVSMTSMGGGEAPVNSSSRVLAAFWWFFSFVMISSYSANLAAYLTVSRFKSPIEDLSDLVSQYKISYSTVNNSDTMNYFRRMSFIEQRLFDKWLKMNIFDTSYTEQQRSQFSVFDYPLSDRFIKIFKHMEATGFVADLDEGIKKVRASPEPGTGYALLLDSIDAKYQELISCDLEVIDEFYKRPMALAVQKNSYLKDQLNSVILELSNKRVLAQLKEKWWTNNPHRAHCKVEDVSGDSVGFENIAGVFIFLACALGILILATLANYCWSARKNNYFKRRISNM